MAVTAASTDQLFHDYEHDHDFILGPSNITTASTTSTTTAASSSASSSITSTAPVPLGRPSTTASSIFSRRPSLFGGSSKSSKVKSSSHKHSQSTIHHTTPSSLLPSRTVTPPTIYLPPPSPTSSSSTAATAADAAQYEPSSKVPGTPHRRRHASRHSISSSVADIGSQLRRSRSASLRTNNSSNSTNGTPPRPSASSHKRTPSYTLALSFSPEKNPTQNAPAAASRPALSISTFSRSKQKSSENVKADGSGYEKSPLSAVDKPKTPYGMAVPLRHPPSQKEIQLARQNTANSFNGGLAPAAPIALPSGSNPSIIFQHIQEMASKRISTLDYLRKAHEGRIYWFNTLLFSKNDLTRLPSFTPRNLSRRATQYLLLGFSLPTILDLNANSPADYLKALNALLVEFEQYQSIHPADGSAPSSLSRARIPQMFKRVNVGGKGRRSSSAAGDFPLLTPQNSFNEPASAVDSPPTDDLLLPNESYSYLQTPSLPFDPDFFSTFATLCDVLIDCYTKILSLLSTPESVAAAGGGAPNMVGELFNKADARVRKIILAGVVREFEESCRQGVRGEVGGVGKVVLGGLM